MLESPGLGLKNSHKCRCRYMYMVILLQFAKKATRTTESSRKSSGFQDVLPHRFNRLSLINVCFALIISWYYSNRLHSLTNMDTSESRTNYSDGINRLKKSSKRNRSVGVHLKVNICLKEILLLTLFLAFLTYLASYSGLSIFNLTCGAPTMKIPTTLPPNSMHSRSISRISNCGVSATTTFLISQRLNLKHLVVGIIPSQVDLDPIPEPSSASQDVIVSVTILSAFDRNLH